MRAILLVGGHIQLPLALVACLALSIAARPAARGALRSILADGRLPPTRPTSDPPPYPPSRFASPVVAGIGDLGPNAQSKNKKSEKAQKDGLQLFRFHPGGRLALASRVNRPTATGLHPWHTTKRRASSRPVTFRRAAGVRRRMIPIEHPAPDTPARPQIGCARNDR